MVLIHICVERGRPLSLRVPCQCYLPEDDSERECGNGGLCTYKCMSVGSVWFEGAMAGAAPFCTLVGKPVRGCGSACGIPRMCFCVSAECKEYS